MNGKAVIHDYTFQTVPWFFGQEKIDSCTTRNAFITNEFTNGKLKKSVSINFTNGLTDVKNPSVKDALIIKNINITDEKLIRR